MIKEDEKLSLSNIKEGAAIEMFDLAMARVFSNIRDINTTLDGREITLKMKITPHEDRTLADIVFGVGVKLANQGNQRLTADIKLDEKGRVYGRERYKQLGLDLVPSNVRHLEDE